MASTAKGEATGAAAGAAAAAGAGGDDFDNVLSWKFCQVFGDRNTEEIVAADIISAIEFDQTGTYIAAGDRGGRVVIFERVGPNGSTARTRQNVSPRHVEYQFLTEFQSHEPEFDYLRSIEVEEKINCIRWVRRMNQSHMVVTTNDKTMKLWKVSERVTKQVTQTNIDPQRPYQPGTCTIRDLRVPRLVPQAESAFAASPRRIYGNAHAYHINGVSLASDCETMLSSDDLRVNLWNVNVTTQSFNIVDMKPENMEELAEVITCSKMHPVAPHLFLYATSRGHVHMGDMRAAALCDQNARVFFEEEDPASHNFFSDMLAQVSDVAFSPCGRYVLSRDYMMLRVWDLNMEAHPLKTIPVHETLRSKLAGLYEHDFLLDKFQCCWSPDSEFLLTGSYGNNFHIFDRNGRVDTCIEASRLLPKKGRSVTGKGVKAGVRGAVGATKTKTAKHNAASGAPSPEEESIDCTKKVLHLAWHPHQNIIAIGALSNLFIYAAI